MHRAWCRTVATTRPNRPAPRRTANAPIGGHDHDEPTRKLLGEFTPQACEEAKQSSHWVWISTRRSDAHARRLADHGAGRRATVDDDHKRKAWQWIAEAILTDRRGNDHAVLLYADEHPEHPRNRASAVEPGHSVAMTSQVGRCHVDPSSRNSSQRPEQRKTSRTESRPTENTTPTPEPIHCNGEQ